MPKDDNVKNEKRQSVSSKGGISKEDAENNRYPDSKIPGVHSDSAPIGGA